MPIYEYKCSLCGSLHEFTMKMSDPHPETCPECGKEKSLVKQISQTAFQLKGGGWYNEAYDGKSNKKTSEKKETAEKPANSGAASKEPASKPAGESKPKTST